MDYNITYILYCINQFQFTYLYFSFSMGFFYICTFEYLSAIKARIRVKPGCRVCRSSAIVAWNWQY